MRVVSVTNSRHHVAPGWASTAQVDRRYLHGGTWPEMLGQHERCRNTSDSLY